MGSEAALSSAFCLKVVSPHGNLIRYGRHCHPERPTKAFQKSGNSTVLPISLYGKRNEWLNIRPAKSNSIDKILSHVPSARWPLIEEGMKEKLTSMWTDATVLTFAFNPNFIKINCIQPQ